MKDVLKPLLVAIIIILIDTIRAAIRDIREDRERYKGEERHEELTDRLE